jgi:hypothetical protein
MKKVSMIGVRIKNRKPKTKITVYVNQFRHSCPLILESTLKQAVENGVFENHELLEK